MILKFKYHSESGLMEAFQSYTLAQNNSLSDTIVITSTASDASKYDYCLEFVCYNTKNIPKAQYISPILKYGDNGIEFSIPNALTEYRGHVDIQLTGYDPNDNTIVFKSISKNSKAFDVEGSLNVLENDLSETPNVFTEVMKKIEELNTLKDDILSVVRDSMDEVSDTFFKGKNWYRVRFYLYNKLLSEQYVVENTVVTPPTVQYLPYGCITDNIWYDLEKNTQHSSTEGITENHDYYLNIWHENLGFDKAYVVSFSGGHNHMYLPEKYNGYNIYSVKADGDFNTSNTYYLYLPSKFEDSTNLHCLGSFYEIFVHNLNPYFTALDGVLYYSYPKALAYYPSKNTDSEYVVNNGTEMLLSNCVCNDKYLKKLILPYSLNYIMTKALCNTVIESITLPASVNQIEDYAFFNNSLLKDIYIEGDIADIINDYTFCTQQVDGTYIRPTLHIHIEYAQKYLAKGLSYDFVIMEQEALDERYVAKA